MTQHGIDPKIALALIEVAKDGWPRPLEGTPEHDKISQIFVTWDDKSDFRRSALAEWNRLHRYFSGYNVGLPVAFPKLYEAYCRLNADEPSECPLTTVPNNLVGQIRLINERFGFIRCPSLDENHIYFNRVSMATGTRIGDLNQGYFVEFRVERFEKGLAARNLKILSADHTG